MVQEQFIEFDEESGIGDLLFVNMNHPIQYRFQKIIIYIGDITNKTVV